MHEWIGGERMPQLRPTSLQFQHYRQFTHVPHAASWSAKSGWSSVHMKKNRGADRMAFMVSADASRSRCPTSRRPAFPPMPCPASA